MKNCLILWSLCLFSLACTNSSTDKLTKEPESSAPFDVIAYYSGDTSVFKNYPTERLTHIIYSFLHLKGKEIAFDKPEDSLTVHALVQLKEKNPSLKVLLSLGGWGGCESCSDVFSTDKGRKEFAESVRQKLTHTHTDGIDLDWEYPAVEGFPGHRYVPEDKKNFTLLVQTLRETLGERYEISFAAGGYTDYLQHAIEWKDVMPLVNRVNLMSYDLINGNSTVTGHHTPLYSTPQQLESTDHAVRYLDSIGVPLSKIIIGAAFYARVFQLDNKDTCEGLNQAAHFKLSIPFRDFQDSLFNRGFVEHWDSVAQAPYALQKEQQEFATYDNARSLAQKTNYVKEKKLGGIMFWELCGDSSPSILLQEIAGNNRSSGMPTTQ